jgi:hypothetical protein
MELKKALEKIKYKDLQDLLRGMTSWQSKERFNLDQCNQQISKNF